MTSRSFRPLTESDWDAWWALRVIALRNHPDAFGSDADEAIAEPESSRRSRFVDGVAHDPNRIMGAFSAGGELVGTCGIRGNLRAKTRHRMDIWGMYVSPESRGTGTGRRLVLAAIEHARQTDGVIQVHLAVASHNTAAISMYSRLGFTTYGHEPRALKLPDRFIDEAFMVLMLDTSPPA